MRKPPRHWTFVSIALLQFFALSSFAQRLPSSASPAAIRKARADCGAPPKLNSLEENSNIETAGKNLATQMILLYHADSSKQPDLGSSWIDLNMAIIAEMHPGCVQQKAFEKTVENAATTSAQAKAATSQTNKQNGAPTAGDGGTSISQKVGIPQLLGIALENGAITNNISGTTMTLSSSPYGVLTAVGKYKDKDIDTESNYMKFHLASQVGFSATFNIASNSDSLTSATRKQVSQWQAKLAFRDTSGRSAKVRDYYYAGPAIQAGKVAADLSNSRFYNLRNLLGDPEKAVYDRAWSASLYSEVAKAAAPSNLDSDEVDQQAKEIADRLLQLLDKDPDYQQALGKLSSQLNAETTDLSVLVNRLKADNADFLAAEDKFADRLKDIPKGWNGDLSFSEKFPTSTSTASTKTAASVLASSTTAVAPAMPAYLAGELDVTCEPRSDKSQKVPCLPMGSGTLTGNFTGSFYTNPNPSLNEKTFRGVQAALQAQWSLGPGLVRAKQENDDSKMTVAVSSNYERLQENKDRKGKRPDVVLGNIKIEIPISSGVSFPLSFTVANASEQIKETYVKGNFGISFDLDKLSSLLKARQATE